MLKKIFTIVATIFLMVGYGGEFPNNLDRTDSLTGIDKNKNGIRDDIEDYINKNYSDEGHRKAMMQYAKTSLAVLLVDISDKIAVKQADIRRSRASHCIFLKFDAKRGDENPNIAWKKIRSMTTNTKARLKAYLDFDKSLAGMAFALPEEDTCE
ncbi:MAG: hypothetical protein LBG21_04700 [Campylobacteraceae bacterium]|jgi:hypothetical protein|nr:hypothetical protein [Campylobacteraceae bacterium]